MLLAKDMSLSIDGMFQATSESAKGQNDKPQPDGDLTQTTKVISPVLKALIGASVTTQDADFDQHYKTTLENVFKRHGIRQEKVLYKGAHLVRQVGDDFDKIFTDILNDIGPAIAHINLYYATYPKEWVSIYGRAQGRRVTPMDYMKDNQNGFVQACTWWHWRQFSVSESEYEYHLDHFDGKSTPSWVEMVTEKVNMKVYYSGCECDCLISFADLILKVIEEYHFGDVDYRNLPSPIWKRCSSYALKKKVAYAYDLSKYDWVIQATVPDTYLHMNLTPHIKHPVYFIAWTPKLPRNTVKRSFEWSKLYNAVLRKAIEAKGCVKFLDFDADMTMWENEDYIIPWEDADREHVGELVSMGFDKMPKILNSKDIIT